MHCPTVALSLVASLFLGMPEVLAQGAEVNDVLNAGRAKAQTHFDKMMTDVDLKKDLVGQMTAYKDSARKSKTPTDAIKKKDELWIAWYENKLAYTAGKLTQMPDPTPEASDLIKRSCSEKLKVYMKANPDIVEIFAMDASGVTICAADFTSDYDQGDEPKWFEPFLNSVSPFVEKPVMDRSTKSYQVKVSFSVKEGDKKIGVITIGLKPGV